jgi:hypothetical protein
LAWRKFLVWFRAPPSRTRNSDLNYAWARLFEIYPEATPSYLPRLTNWSDSTTHSQRLNELIAQETATKAEIATLNAMAAETRRPHSTAQATNIVSDNRKAALDKREAELDERAKNLDLSEATKSDAALRGREAAVSAREEVNKREGERLAAMRRDLEGRLGKVRNLATTLER